MNRRVSGASARVRFELESRAENVALVRSGLSALAEETHIAEPLLSDLKTAVSEACNNVVLHAYGPETGPLIVTVDVNRASVEATIVDHGSGVTQVRNSDGHIGLGLGIMSALSSRFEVISPVQGTEVRMWFDRGERREGAAQIPEQRWLEKPPLRLSGDAVVWVEPASLLSSVLGRVLRAYAAASRFTADRADELPAVGAALSDYAELAADGKPVGVAMAAHTRRLQLVSGPYPRASLSDDQQRIRAQLSELVEDLDVAPIDGQPSLSFTVSDSPSN